jgi:hypothetical protein
MHRISASKQLKFFADSATATPPRILDSRVNPAVQLKSLPETEEKMRYLVTGGAGFIGSNTVDELVRRGHSVVVLDDLSAGGEENLAEVRNNISFIKGSITDLGIVEKAMEDADYVLHLAARDFSAALCERPLGNEPYQRERDTECPCRGTR